jgi:hypothetical protein
MSDETSGSSLVHWHNHFHWDADSVRTRDRIGRVLSLIYPDGTGDDVGNLVVLPRGLNDPVQRIDKQAPHLPGETAVRVAPGSVVIIDSALWHTARRGNRPGRRHLLGGQFQGWLTDRPHPDDHDVDLPVIAGYKQDPVFRGLIERPSVAAARTASSGGAHD